MSACSSWTFEKIYFPYQLVGCVDLTKFDSTISTFWKYLCRPPLIVCSAPEPTNAMGTDQNHAFYGVMFSKPQFLCLQIIVARRGWWPSNHLHADTMLPCSLLLILATGTYFAKSDKNKTKNKQMHVSETLFPQVFYSDKTRKKRFLDMLPFSHYFLREDVKNLTYFKL